MNPALAVFVKTPALSPVKTRLAATIGTQQAQAFYSLAVMAVRQTLQQTQVTSFFAVGDEAGLQDPLWQGFKTLHTGTGDLGARQGNIYNQLLVRFDRVILIGADAPQISPQLIQQALQALEAHEFVMGPAYDGGYYLFGGRVPLSPDIWAAVPWSHAETRKTLETLLPSPAYQLPFLTDVDTEDELQKIIAEMPTSPHEAQQNIIAWITDNKNACT